MIDSVHSLCNFFFFFKQKTAYEIVSREWSSDVCSSDLNFRYNGYLKNNELPISSLKHNFEIGMTPYSGRHSTSTLLWAGVAPLMASKPSGNWGLRFVLN